MFITTAPFHKSIHYVFVLLTSALCPGVSPEVLLTVCAGLPSKAITTLTLPSELHDRVEKQAWHIHFFCFCQCEWIMWTYILHHEKMFRSKCSIPHYMRRWLSCWDHSRRVHSPSRWPGSSGWGHSGHMSDLWHLADTGTALWHAGTHSPHALYTGCVQCPGSYMCTLKGK